MAALLQENYTQLMNIQCVKTTYQPNIDGTYIADKFIDNLLFLKQSTSKIIKQEYILDINYLEYKFHLIINGLLNQPLFFVGKIISMARQTNAISLKLTKRTCFALSINP